MNEEEKILVIKLGALGDFIQALGPMAAIRRHHPGAAITLLTTAPYAGMARECGYFDHVWTDARPRWNDLRGWIALRDRLNGGGFSRIYDLQNNDRTAMYFRLFGRGSRPEWVGAAKGASHRNASPLRTAGQAFDGHVQTLELAGIKDVSIDRMKWVKGDTGRFGLPSPYMLIVPGSAPDRPEKRWPASHYGELARMIGEKGYAPVIIGTEAERDTMTEIAAACPGITDLCGRTSLMDIALLARDAVAGIGNDTGPMHLIAATGCPCLVLFSKHSDPARHAPKGDAVTVIRRDDLKDLAVGEVARMVEIRGSEERPDYSADGE